MTFEEATEFVRKTIQEDEQLRGKYRSDISMKLFRSKLLNLRESYDVTDQIMNLLFDIPLTRY